jgi:hypothetical protein
MKLSINQEMLKGLGKAGLKIGKNIVMDGTKALLLKSATAAITTSFEEGFGGIKTLTLDDILAGKKKHTEKVLKKTVEVVEVEVDEAEVTK